MTDASALFDDEDDNDGRDAGANEDPYAFADSDEERYDEQRRHSLLSNGSDVGEGPDSDDSVVPPSQSEGDSNDEETSADEEQELP